MDVESCLGVLVGLDASGLAFPLELRAASQAQGRNGLGHGAARYRLIFVHRPKISTRPPLIMVLPKPQREDVELVVAGEHRIEAGEVAKGLLHHLGAGIDEDSMDAGDGAAELLGGLGRQ